jgi:predicted Zn-dependent peptidase
MNFSLGGAFNSRINLNLREDKGYTYGARSRFGASKDYGTYKFSSEIKKEATDSAIKELMFERSNVVVIQQKIHKKFHKLYGTQNITEEKWNSFLENKEYL